MPKPNKFAVPRELRFRLGTLADKAKVSERTIQDYITGRRKNRSAAVRDSIERTLREDGLTQYIRAEQ